MTQNLYKQLLLIIGNYDFSSHSNLYDFFKFAKKAGLRDLSFKTFVKYVKNMGVSSRIKRVDGVVSRSLVYDKQNDLYIKELFPLIDTCPNCDGSGLVKVTLA